MRVFFLYVYIVCKYIIIQTFFNPQLSIFTTDIIFELHISIKIIFEHNAIDDKPFTTMTSFLDLLPQTDCEIASTIGIF